MNLTELQAAIVAHISTTIPALAQCEAYGGQFERVAGKTVAIHAPAVFVDVLEAVPFSIANAEQMDVDAQFIAYCVDRYAGKRGMRESSCMALAQQVAFAVNMQHFALVGVGCVQVKRMRTLTSILSDQTGFSIWRVDFSMPVTLGTPPVDTTTKPTTLRIGFNGALYQ